MNLVTIKQYDICSFLNVYNINNKQYKKVLIMETRVVQVYQYYNSMISQGKRVRRMRRTQLSAQKIRNNSSSPRGEMYFYNTQTSKSKQVFKQRSVPKVQPRKIKQNTNKKQIHMRNVNREYYAEIRPINSFKQYSQSNSRKQSNRQSQVNSSRQQSQDHKKLSAENNSFVKALKQNYNDGISSSQMNGSQNRNSMQVNSSVNQLSPHFLQKNSSNSRSKQQIKINGSNYKINQSNASGRSSKKKSVVEYPSVKKSLQMPNKMQDKLDQYGIKGSQGSKLSLQQRMSNRKSQISSLQNSKVSQKNQQKNQNKSIQNLRNQQIKQQLLLSPERVSAISESKQPKQSSIHHKNPTNFHSKLQQSQQQSAKQFDEIFSKQISNLNQAEHSNFSKLKIQNLATSGSPIVHGSSAKRESWRQAIKSLTELDDNLNNNSHHDQKTVNHMISNSSSKGNGFFDSKKMSLKIDSMRQDNIDSSQKLSWKHLPLASKQPSQRRSFDSISSKYEPGSLKGVLESIQIHEFLVGLLNQFAQNTLKLNQDQPDTQLVCFLLQRKHFLQKANIIKALKGGKNIFRLSSIQITTQNLKQYYQNQQIIKLVKQLEVESRQLFKNLQKNYMQLKPKLKSNPYFKLQTPSDNFSKQIVRILDEQLQDLYKKLKTTTSQESQQILQNRIFEIMEIIFLLSELGGRSVKKIEFFDEIKDFQEYYNQQETALLETVEYFNDLK